MRETPSSISLISPALLSCSENPFLCVIIISSEWIRHRLRDSLRSKRPPKGFCSRIRFFILYLLSNPSVHSGPFCPVYLSNFSNYLRRCYRLFCSSSFVGGREIPRVCRINIRRRSSEIGPGTRSLISHCSEFKVGQRNIDVMYDGNFPTRAL